jgi:hypothetical protein
MDDNEDHIALAAEYALGTLNGDERAQVETMMAADKDFTAMVRAWEYRLGVLNQMVGSVEPRAEVWDRIRAVTGLSERQAPIVLPEPATAPPPPAPTQPGEAASPAADQANVVRLADRARRWRGVASAMTAIAVRCSESRSFNRTGCPKVCGPSRARRSSRSGRLRLRQRPRRNMSPCCRGRTADRPLS